MQKTKIVMCMLFIFLKIDTHGFDITFLIKIIKSNLVIYLSS